MTGFSVVIEYPRKLEIDSVVHFDGKRIQVEGITKIEPVTEKAFLVSGYGKRLKGTGTDEGD